MDDDSNAGNAIHAKAASQRLYSVNVLARRRRNQKQCVSPTFGVTMALRPRKTLRAAPWLGPFRVMFP